MPFLLLLHLEKYHLAVMTQPTARSVNPPLPLRRAPSPCLCGPGGPSHGSWGLLRVHGKDLVDEGVNRGSWEVGSSRPRAAGSSSSQHPGQVGLWEKLSEMGEVPPRGQQSLCTAGNHWAQLVLSVERLGLLLPGPQVSQQRSISGVRPVTPGAHTDPERRQACMYVRTPLRSK